MTRFVWIPEAPSHPGLYANLSDDWQPHKSIGAPLQPSTYNVYLARQFATREECQAWCDANPSPQFVPVEHGFEEGAAK